MVERRLLSVHIEKTGGTSVRGALVQHFGPERVLLYDRMNDAVMRASERTIQRENPRVDEIIRRLKQVPLLSQVRRLHLLFKEASEQDLRFPPEQLPDDFDVLHGHLDIERFEGIFKNPRLITVVRDPLERMISHYQHAGVIKGKSRIPPPGFSKSMEFEEFSMLPSLQNFQTRRLGGKTLSDFYLVGTTEKLPDFLLALGLINKGDSTPFLNKGVGRSRSSVSITAGFRRLFETQHALDYETYANARDSFSPSIK